MFLGVLDRYGALSGMPLRIDVLFFFCPFSLFFFLLGGFGIFFLLNLVGGFLGILQKFVVGNWENAFY